MQISKAFTEGLVQPSLKVINISLAAERQSVLHGHLELQFAAARYE
jgi:hypothetical protein